MGFVNLYWVAFSGHNFGDIQTGLQVGLVLDMCPLILETFPVYYIYIKIRKVKKAYIVVGRGSFKT